MKKSLFESLAGSLNDENTPTRGRIMTESEKRRKESVKTHFRDRFCSESSQSFSEKDPEVDRITYTDKISESELPEGSCQ